MARGDDGSADKPQAGGMSGQGAGAVSLIIVAAMVAFGVMLVAHAREFLAHHQATGGVVTAVSARTNCDQGGCSTDYDWTVRYRPPGSRSLTFTGGGNPDSTPVGTHVRVYYLVSDPRDAMLNPGTAEEHGGIFLIAAGLVGLAIASGNYRVADRP